MAAGTTSGTAAVASSTVVAANNGRRLLVITNLDAAENVFLSLGDTAVVGSGIRIGPGGFFRLERATRHAYMYSGAINAIRGGGSDVALAIEERDSDDWK